MIDCVICKLARQFSLLENQNLKLFSLIERQNLLNLMNSEFAKTIVMVTHDPKAAAHGQRTLHLEKGMLEREEITTRRPVAAAV